MPQTTLLNDIYGVVGSDGAITDLNVDGRDIGLVQATTNAATGVTTFSRRGTDLNVVTAETNQVTGGIGILGPDGKQHFGDGTASAFTSRDLTDADNGMTHICATAQTAGVPPGLVGGFGNAFKGAVSFTAGDGVTVNDVRTTGSAAPWCALVQTAANAYDVVGGTA